MIARSRLDSPHLRRLFEATCRAAVEIFGVDHSGLVLFEGDGSHGKVVAEFPPRRAVGAIVRTAGIPLEQDLLRGKQPIEIYDINETLAELGQVGELLSRLGIRSILVVPVVIARRVVGSFSLDVMAPRGPRRFTKSEVDRCRALADQVAVAIGYASHSVELSAVRTLTLEIARGALPRQEVLRSVVKLAVKLLRAHSGGLYAYDEKRRTALLVADFRRSTTLVGKELPLGEGLVGRLLKSRRTWSAVKDYNRYRWRSPAFQSMRPFAAVLEVKLLWDGRTLGVLYVDDRAGRVFTAQDAKLLQLFADHAAIALVESERRERDGEMLDRLRYLPVATSDMLDASFRSSASELLSTVAAYAATIVNAQHAAVSLGHDHDSPEAVAYFPPFGQTGYSGALPRQLSEASARASSVTNLSAKDIASRLGKVKGPTLGSPSPPPFSYLGVPLRHRPGGDLIGLLEVANAKAFAGPSGRPPGFTEADESLLELFSYVVAAAIANAQRLDEARDDVAMASEAFAGGPLLRWVAHQSRHLLGLVELTLSQFDAWAQSQASIPPRRKRELAGLKAQAADAKEAAGSFLDMVVQAPRGAREATDVNDVARRTIRILTVALKQAQVETYLELSGNLPPVWGNRLELVEILSNLIRNALKAMEDSTSRELTIRTRHDGRWVQIWVSDTGSGINKDKVKDLFKVGRSESGGHGVGLAAAKDFLEVHYQGRLSLSHTAAGKGTTFLIQLKPHTA